MRAPRSVVGGGRRAGAGQCIVGRIGAVDGDTVDSDGLGCPNVLVVKVGRCGGIVEDVAADAVIGECDGRHRGPFVGLVAGGRAHRESPRRDARGGRRAGAGECVVGRIVAVDGDTSGGDGLGSPDVLVVEVGRGIIIVEDVAADAVIDESDGRARGPFVDLVAGHCAHCQRPRRDARGGRRAGAGECIVGRVVAVDVDTVDGDGLGSPDVLVVEVGRGIIIVEDVATDAVIGESDGRARGPIVDLVAGDGAHCESPGSDVGGGRRAGAGECVVGRIVAVDG